MADGDKNGNSHCTRVRGRVCVQILREREKAKNREGGGVTREGVRKRKRGES